MPRTWAFPTEINVFEWRIWILNSHGILCVWETRIEFDINFYIWVDINFDHVFCFSRDDAVSNTVSRSVVAGKLGLAPHPVQNEGNCTWIRSVDVTCDYLRRLRSPWSPTGIAPWGTVTHRLRTSEAFEGWSSKRVTIKFLDHRWSPVGRLRRIGLSWVVSCVSFFVSDSSFLSSLDVSQSDYVRFVRILQVMSFSHSSRYEHKTT